MKRNLLLSLLLFLMMQSFGQIQWTGNQNASFFIKELSVNSHSGKSFRFEIAVHAPGSELPAGIKLEMATYENQLLVIKPSVTETRREQDWVVFSLSGKIPEAADKLCAIVSIHEEGLFYFDDVNFYIESDSLRWKQITVSNPSFEEGDYRVPGYIIRSNDNISGYQLSTDIFKIGTQSLLVENKKSRRTLQSGSR